MSTEAASELARKRGSPPGLLALPDDLCIRCLGSLSSEERHKALPLTCRRLRQLVNRPQLLANVEVVLWHTPSLAMLPRLRSLCGWLLSGAGQHVRRLALKVPTNRDVDPVEAGALLAGMVAACGNSLQELRLEVDMDLCCSTWVLAARHLRHLHIDTCNHQVMLTAALHPLTQLERLSLMGGEGEVGIHADASLPSSITWMDLGDYQDTSLPHQIAGLTRLQVLSLTNGQFAADGYSKLLQLTALRRLVLDDCTFLPACLGELTGLEALAILDASEYLYDGSVLLAALPQLMASLTCLVVSDVPVIPHPPRQLTSLTRLQTLCWSPPNDTDLDEEAQVLPGGSWIATLRSLHAPAHTLHASLPALDAACSLTRLGMSSGNADPHQTMAAVLQWAVRHPPLQALELQADDGVLGRLFVGAASALQRRPGITVTRSTTLFEPASLYELCLDPSSATRRA